MAAPAVALLVQRPADDARRLELPSLGLHPLHGKLARLVQRLGVVGKLDVAREIAEQRPLRLGRVRRADRVAGDQVVDCPFGQIVLAAAELDVDDRVGPHLERLLVFGPVVRLAYAAEETHRSRPTLNDAAAVR